MTAGEEPGAGQQGSESLHRTSRARSVTPDPVREDRPCCKCPMERDSPAALMADRVLVVDDEQSLRKVLSATLQREGYEVQVAADGEEALAALERDGADVVVTDLVMPRMDGLTLLRKVVKAHPDIPVIVVTHSDLESDRESSFKAGANSFLNKSVDLDIFAKNILIELERWLGLGKKQD